MCVAKVTRQDVNVCRRKCKHLFLPQKNKRTKIMQHTKATTIKKCSVHHYDKKYFLCRSNFTCVIRTMKSCVRTTAQWCSFYWCTVYIDVEINNNIESSVDRLSIHDTKCKLISIISHKQTSVVLSSALCRLRITDDVTG